jgi:hypothetical protein
LARWLTSFCVPVAEPVKTSRPLSGLIEISGGCTEFVARLPVVSSTLDWMFGVEVDKIRSAVGKE